MSELIKEEVDLTNVDVQQCPYDAYKKLREEAPVYKDPKTGFFIITKYKDVRTVLSDAENFKNLLGNDAKFNADKMINIFKGEDNDFSKAVCLNTAAGLIVAEKFINIKDAYIDAREHILSGKTFKHLQNIQSA